MRNPRYRDIKAAMRQEDDVTLDAIVEQAVLEAMDCGDAPSELARRAAVLALEEAAKVCDTDKGPTFLGDGANKQEFGYQLACGNHAAAIRAMKGGGA